MATGVYVSELDRGVPSLDDLLAFSDQSEQTDNERLKGAFLRQMLLYAAVSSTPTDSRSGYRYVTSVSQRGDISRVGATFTISPVSADDTVAAAKILPNNFIGYSEGDPRGANSWIGQIESVTYNESSNPPLYTCILKAGTYGNHPTGVVANDPVTADLWGGHVAWRDVRDVIRPSGSASDEALVSEKAIRDALAALGGGGWITSATAPLSPVLGSGWFDTGTRQLKTWHGSYWLPVWAAAGMSVKTSNYQVVGADDGGTLVYTGSSDGTFTLIAPAQNLLGYRLWVLNNSSQTLTIATPGTETVNSTGTFTVKAGEHALLVLTSTANWTAIPFGTPAVGNGLEVNSEGEIAIKLDGTSLAVSSSGLRSNIPNASNTTPGLVELTDNTERANRSLDDYHVPSVADVYWIVDNEVGNALVERNYGISFEQSDMLPGATDGEWRLLNASDAHVPVSGSVASVRKLQIGKRQWPDGADIINANATTSFQTKLSELKSGDRITLRLWNSTTNQVVSGKRIVVTLTGPGVYTDVSGTHATDGDYFTFPCTATKVGTLEAGMWWQFELDHNVVSVVGSRVESPLGITRGLTDSPVTALVEADGTVKRSPLGVLLEPLMRAMPHYAMTRNFKDNLDSAVSNEAIISTDNTAVFGVTDFVAVDDESAAADLRDTRAGDWMYVHVPQPDGKFAEIFAELAGARLAPNETTISQLWYKTPIYSFGLNQYRQFAASNNGLILILRSVLPVAQGGTGVTTIADLRELVQQFNEPRQLTGTYTRKDNGTSSAAGEWDVNASVPDLGSESGGNPNTALLTFRRKNADVGWFASHWIVGAQLQFGDRPNDYVLQIVTNPVNVGQYWTAGVQRVAGTIPAVDAVTSAELRGFDPHRTEFVGQVWEDHTDNVGGRGGTSGQVWTRGSNNENASWADASKRGAGAGLALNGNDLDVDAGDGIEVTNGEVKAKLDGSTLARSSNGLKVADDGVGVDQLDASGAAAGKVLKSSSATEMGWQDDDTVVSFQNSAPSSPQKGQLWWDADSSTNPLASKSGVHRRNVTELEGTTGGSAPGLSLMTASYTPKENNARIFVRVRILASCVGNSDNDYSQIAIRVKRGTNNYKRIDEGADGYTAISGERMWQYSDNTARAHYEEFVLEPQNNKNEIKVNLTIFMKDGGSVSSTTGRLNRWGTNRNAGPSFIEIYEMVAGGTMTYQTTTTLDSA